MPDIIKPCELPKRDNSISTPNIIWPCVHSNGEDNISWLRSSERVSYPREMMESHTRRRFTLCMLFKGENGMPCQIFANRVCWPRFMSACHGWTMKRLTSSVRMCCLSSMRTCHATRRPIVCVFEGQWLHAMPDVVWSCIFPRTMMACHARSHSTVCTFQGRWWHCHGQRCLTVYIAQWPWWYDTPNVVWWCFAIQGRWWHATPDIV